MSERSQVSWIIGLVLEMLTHLKMVVQFRIKSYTPTYMKRA